MVALVACCGSVIFVEPVRSCDNQQVGAIAQAKTSRTPSEQKLDSHLYLMAQAARGAVNAPTLPSLSTILQGLEVDDKGKVHVDIQGSVNPGLLSEISTLGGVIESSFPNYGAIRAWIPPSAAETLAARPDVTFIKPAAKATTNSSP